MQTIRPIRDQVAIKPDEREAVTAGGIILPEKAQARPVTGEVVGLGVEAQDCGELAIGDKVLFTKYSGNAVTLDNDEEYIVVPIDSVLAVMEEK